MLSKPKTMYVLQRML